MYRPIAASLMLLVAIVNLPAQEELQAVTPGRVPIGILLTAEGDRLSLFRNGRVATYDPYLESAAGVPLVPGTLLQLEEDTTVELQLLPGRTRVKAAAQATLRLDEVDPDGGGRITVYFGRLRVVVPQRADQPVSVIGPDAEVIVEPGSDAAVDVLADPSTAAAYTAVSTVSGRATISPRPTDITPEPIGVPAGSSARTRASEEGLVVTTSGEFPDGVAAFWLRRGFEAEPLGGEVLEERFRAAFAYVYGFYGSEPVAAAPPEPEEPTPAPTAEPEIEPLPTLPELDLTPPEFAGRDRTELRNGGIGLMAMGAFFAGAGFGIDYAANAILSEGARPGSPSPGTVILYAGGGFFASGLITFIVSQF